MDMYFNKLYKEPHRNQFHYSPPYGWMNDINGMWYLDGVYHITYQYSPDALKCNVDNIGIGHAYSKDLIHWYAAPLALSCGKQFEHGVLSGSAYVDTENRAGFGKNAVIMANTDLHKGQYITVSTDGGWNFVGIEENPVVVVQDDTKEVLPRDQRDPKIFWLDSEKCFIMVVYLQRRVIPGDDSSKIYPSMEFYSSKDMKNWTLFQRLEKKDIIEDLKRQGKDTACLEELELYPHECPNLIPMECNGETYWVFHGGDSRYVIGKFEGLHYTVIHAPLEPMSYGPCFYAGQTIENVNRTVAIFWLGSWGGLTVSSFPFRCSATIPTELALKETPDGLRIYRYPIKELETIYDNEIKITSDSCECSAPYFDAEFTIDWTKTASDSITIKVAEKEYVLEKNRFCAEHIQKPGLTEIEFSEDVTAVRVLADRDSVEMFFNNGRKSYTEEYGFKADVLDFSLVSENGKTLSVNGTFRTLKSIWE